MHPRAENPALHDQSDAHARGPKRERRCCRTQPRRDRFEIRLDSQPRSLLRATGACWRKDGRRQCTRHGARAPRGMNGRIPCEQARWQRGRERPSGVRRQALAAFGRGVAHAPAALSRSIADDDSGLGRQTPPPVIVACKSRGHQRIDGPLLSPTVCDLATRPAVPS